MYLQAHGKPRIKLLRRMDSINSSGINHNMVSALTGPSSKELMNKEFNNRDSKNRVRCGFSRCGE